MGSFLVGQKHTKLDPPSHAPVKTYRTRAFVKDASFSMAPPLPKCPMFWGVRADVTLILACFGSTVPSKSYIVQWRQLFQNQFHGHHLPTTLLHDREQIRVPLADECRGQCYCEGHCVSGGEGAFRMKWTPLVEMSRVLPSSPEPGCTVGTPIRIGKANS